MPRKPPNRRENLLQKAPSETLSHCGSTNIHNQELESRHPTSELYDTYCRNCKWSGDISPDIPLGEEKTLQEIITTIQPLNGLLGKQRAHVVLGQNAFRYSDGLYDIDYTAVPLPWATSASVVQKGHVGAAEAKVLLNSFTLSQKEKSGKTVFNRGRCSQRRLKNH